MRSGEPLERDPSGDDGEGSETTNSGDAVADADPSMFMTLSGVESIAVRLKRKKKEDVMFSDEKEKGKVCSLGLAVVGCGLLRQRQLHILVKHTSPNWASWPIHTNSLKTQEMVIFNYGTLSNQVKICIVICYSYNFNIV